MEYNPQELALAIRKLIENRPENWQQRIWYGYVPQNATVDSIRMKMDEGFCGTVACVAGWAVILTAPGGTKFVDDKYHDATSVEYPDGTIHTVSKVAQDALGLTDRQTGWLFGPERSREEVISYLTKIENNLI